MIMKILKYILIVCLALLITATAAVIGYVEYNKHQGRNDAKITTANGIEEQRWLKLGGVEQWISIRGQDRDNPVLLFVHGGPGATAIPMHFRYNLALEEHFVVVHWDQRGTGKSWDKDVYDETLTLEQLIEDTKDLSIYLQDELEKEKLFLAGHSWGSAVGIYTVAQHPELYHAYIGISQIVNFKKSEQISYEFTLETARKLDHVEALAELEAIDPPPWPTEGYAEPLSVQRKWLHEFGGEVYSPKEQGANTRDILETIFFTPEYSIVDSVNSIRGNRQSAEHLWDTLLALDIAGDVSELAVPVWFLTGAHDYVTAFSLVEEFYNTISAPGKKLEWFHESSHSPNYEEPEKYLETLVAIKREVLAD
ncbi:MAG: alpha/beta hydrolase [Firmicutes bacterium]|nr:alpha/beta hydrolase [Bacillota bacterium]